MREARSESSPLSRAGASALLLLLVSLCSGLLAPACRAEVVINEVVYDPAGSDTGFEWVELYNSGPADRSLAGWSLQRDVNGPWTSTATAVAAALRGTIPAKGFFLIEETEAAAAQPCDLCGVSLAFSNASAKADAVRLLDASGAEADRLVYGPPDSDGIGAEGGAGEEAPAVESGSSLARMVDGRDRADNRADFIEDVTPTPRAANDAAGVVREDVPGSLSLPNPFLPAAQGFVTFTTPERIVAPLSEVRIYALDGELVRTLREPRWDGRNDDGQSVAAGLYYYVVETDAGKARGKVTLIK